jgi:putative cell wall-binding protein
VDETVVQQAGAYAPAVERLAGSDRFATSAAVSQRFFDPGMPAVYFANGYNFPDALSGAAAAAAGGGPVLLTEANWMPEVVRVEFRELDPDTVVLLGGSSVLTDGLLREVRRMLTMDWPRPVA